MPNPCPWFIYFVRPLKRNWNSKLIRMWYIDIVHWSKRNLLIIAQLYSMYKLFLFVSFFALRGVCSAHSCNFSSFKYSFCFRHSFFSRIFSLFLFLHSVYVIWLNFTVQRCHISLTPVSMSTNTHHKWVNTTNRHNS